MLEDFVVGSICRVIIKDVKKKLEAAIAVLEEYCGKQMTDAGDMLAAFNNLFGRHMHQLALAWLTHRRRFSEDPKVPQKVPRVGSILRMTE